MPSRILAVLFCTLLLTATFGDERQIAGWKVHVHPRLLADQAQETEVALKLLEQQLKEIVNVVPTQRVKQLQEVPLYFSPEYPNHPPRAEFHPDAGWLKKNGRDPAMAKGVEFTNVRIFERETKRMPNFALHELAHAFHNRVLGFDDAEIKAAFERAKASKKYDSVERSFGDGKPNRLEKSYAMTNPMEYFAELTESYFSRNDFFPFTRDELRKHDPEMTRLLERLWLVPASKRFSFRVVPPPAELKAPECYTKYVDADGYPIVASERVSDYALKEAAFLVCQMLANRPDVKEAMVRGGSRLCILAHNEFTTDLPEFSKLAPKDYWDARARGTGGSKTDPFCSCGEENLLGYKGDPYSTECILIHEFAHNIHLRGMVEVDSTFDGRVKEAFDKAKSQGLWKGTYASTNSHEYFAEGVQSWFNNNRPPDHDHNEVDTRAELLEYDPGLAALCREVFGDTEIVYTKPATRLTDHLSGYDPSSAPEFVWPERLQAARKAIREQALNRK